MAHVPAVPFALPDRRAPRASPLGMPQFVVLLAGVLLVPLFFFLWLLYPAGLDLWARHEVLAYRAAFGFDVGDVLTDAGYDTGVLSVTPAVSPHARGLRAGGRDPVASRHARELPARCTS